MNATDALRDLLAAVDNSNPPFWAPMEQARKHAREVLERTDALAQAEPVGTPDWFPLLGTPFAIRWDNLNERQARLNHDQSLSRLAQRGGLSPCEAAAVVESRKFRSIAYKDAFDALILATPQPAPVVTDAMVEAAARLRNAAYAVLPRSFPFSLNHPDSAIPNWEREFIADKTHYKTPMQAIHALEKVLRALPEPIESRGVQLARAALSEATKCQD